MVRRNTSDALMAELASIVAACRECAHDTMWKYEGSAFAGNEGSCCTPFLGLEQCAST
jgi:hypothetical protein